MSSPTPLPTLGATLLPSVLRTIVPIIYAMLVRWGVVSWLGIDDALVNNAITAVVTMFFYIALRIAERYKSQIGWLLGYGQQPVYVTGEVISVTTEPTPGTGDAEPTTTTTVETSESPDEIPPGA